MIRFNKDAVNTVVVTLTENATVANPIYLFLFTNQQSNVDYYFTATDLSNFKERYNKFLITEKLNPNTLNGEISLDEEGFYNYFVYQTSLYQKDGFITRVEDDNGTFEAASCLQTTLNNLQGLTTASEMIPYITKEVENGLVWVVPSLVSNSTYTPQSDTSIIYQPE